MRIIFQITPQNYKKNPTYASVCRIFFAGMLLFLHSLVLFHGLRGDSGRGFCAVTNLRVGGACADGTPSLAARHSRAHCNANKRY